jgi:molybdopterin/thiamine biosynthesis adenylyltransferase
VQRLLKAARVTLIGLGGTGGAAALALAGTGVGALHCVDADEVSLSNLNRQVLYTTADVGRTKAEAALDRLRLVNPDITVTAEERMIASAAGLARASAGSSLLVLCADQPAELRLWANRVCLAARRPWVDSGYYGPLVTAGAYVPGQGACWECLRAAERARLGLPETAPAGLVGELHRVPGHPATAITAGLSGQFAAHLAVALLTGVPPVAPGTVWGVNLMLAGQPVLISAPRQPGCPACGQTGPKIPA